MLRQSESWVLIISSCSQVLLIWFLANFLQVILESSNLCFKCRTDLFLNIESTRHFGSSFSGFGCGGDLNFDNFDENISLTMLTMLKMLTCWAHWQGWNTQARLCRLYQVRQTPAWHKMKCELMMVMLTLSYNNKAFILVDWKRWSPSPFQRFSRKANPLLTVFGSDPSVRPNHRRIPFLKIQKYKNTKTQIHEETTKPPTYFFPENSFRGSLNTFICFWMNQGSAAGKKWPSAIDVHC